MENPEMQMNHHFTVLVSEIPTPEEEVKLKDGGWLNEALSVSVIGPFSDPEEVLKKAFKEINLKNFRATVSRLEITQKHHHIFYVLDGKVEYKGKGTNLGYGKVMKTA